MSRVIAICAGRIAPLFADAGDKPGSPLSAIAKQALSTLDNPAPVEIGPTGVTGDEQADLSVHGGPRKAVYVYPFEHYPFWQTIRMQARRTGTLEAGALGENLLVEGLLEKAVWIGDVLAIGDVELRIESPRSPCFKLDARLGFSWAGKMMTQSGFTGFYCSVARAGTASAGDEIALRPGDRVTSVEQDHRLRTRSRQPGLF